METELNSWMSYAIIIISKLLAVLLLQKETEAVADSVDTRPPADSLQETDKEDYSADECKERLEIANECTKLQQLHSQVYDKRHQSYLQFT
jgi:hypothetical protein